MMIRKLALTAAILACGYASAVLAQPPEPQGLSDKYLACHARAKSNTVQDGLCAQVEMSAQDARLNKAYQQVMHQLDNDPPKKTTLRDEQRSWLKKRDYDCKVDGNTIDDGCLVTKTAIRANELEKMVRF
jgi:uncharacterized protein YecT (DUF1311 family)